MNKILLFIMTVLYMLNSYFFSGDFHKMCIVVVMASPCSCHGQSDCHIEDIIGILLLSLVA